MKTLKCHFLRKNFQQLTRFFRNSEPSGPDREFGDAEPLAQAQEIAQCVGDILREQLGVLPLPDTETQIVEKSGIGHIGIDRHDPDSRGAYLFKQAVTESPQSRFGRRVKGGKFGRAGCFDAGDVDDASPVVLQRPQ